MESKNNVQLNPEKSVKKMEQKTSSLKIKDFNPTTLIIILNVNCLTHQ